jgi:cyclopropane fatty-acyl-phospholipid synthase-like methyltransferase
MEMTQEKKSSGKQKRKNYVDNLHRNFEKLVIKSSCLTKIGLFLNKKSTLNELKNLNLSDNCKFLDIGCGSYPWTLLIVASEKNWDFLGIDHDREAVKSAKNMMERFNLSDKVKIKYADALNFDFSKYDIILFSFGVEPRKEIFTNIVKTMKKDGVIIFRTTWETLNSVYGAEIIPEKLVIDNIYYRFDGIKSLLLTLKNIEVTS